MPIHQLYRLILKDGLRTFKFKNSSHQNTPFEAQKGSIFCYRSKSNMISAKGIVMTSLEAVQENATSLSHWTPNAYRYGTYTNKKLRITKGHNEENLRQINTFYVDFDIKNQKDSISYSDILVASLDLGFMPTFILKTDQGYQAYFVLEDAAYVTSENNFKVVNVAKMISQNIRNHFAKTLPVDMTCNHFGIARIPREDNLEYFDKNNIYSFTEWFRWSMQQDDLTYLKKPNLFLLSGTEGQKQVDEPWYNLLRNTSKIRGEKAIMGRNNVIFTLALACYSSGVSYEDCKEELSDFNDDLELPLKQLELRKILRSAYSGKYEAASREFVKVLCQTWIDESLTSKDLFIRQGWYKFKKARADRKRSHFSEWKVDLLRYIEESTSKKNPYLTIKKKDIISQLGIPERSLDYVLKKLSNDNKIFYTFKRGRGGGIRVASISAILSSLITLHKEKRQIYYQQLSKLLDSPQKALEHTLEAHLRSFTRGQQTMLFELDTG